MRAERRKYLLAGLVFLLGFVLALMVGRWWFTPEGPGSAQGLPGMEGVDGGVLQEKDLRDFFAALAAGDFLSMKELGETLFQPGRRIAESGRIFAAYAVNSLPPYSVYALYTNNTPASVRRVLLTLDAAERVESFLAEEMAVIK